MSAMSPLQTSPSQPGDGVVLTMVRSVLRVFVGASFVAAAILPLVGGEFYTRLAIEALMLGLLAVSVDLLLGFAGLLSIGQAAFFGLGAYASALMQLYVSPSVWLTMAAVIAGATLLSLIIGFATSRSSGVYFALVTFCVGEILSKAVANTAALGGHDGLLRLRAPTVRFGPWALDLANNVSFYYLMLALTATVLVGLRALLNTGFGSVLAALRDNPDRVPYLGYAPVRHRVAVFVLAANVAALGGMFYPYLRGFVTPVLFGFEYSTKAVVMALVGGLGSLIGPLGGAWFISFVEVAISAFTKHHMLVIGILFIVCVMAFPKGFYGLVVRRPATTGGRSA
jgi:branched-chain amino acid transport system permease protein